MNKKTLIKLAGTLVALVVLYFIFAPTEKQDIAGAILSALEPNKVSRIQIDQGENKLELSVKDKNWVVTSRGDYPADSSKIRALLVRLAEVNTDQLVTRNKKNHLNLGVTDEDVKAGKSKVTLYDPAGKVLSGLYIGNARNKGSGEGEFSLGVILGQYVRAVNSDDVYVIPEPVTAVAKPNHWLDTTLTDIIANKVETIEQKSGADVQFVVKRDFQVEPGKPGMFKLTVPPVADRKVKENILIQLRSGLEAFRFEDVIPAGDPSAQSLIFDRSTKYTLTDGTIYIVKTAEYDSKFFAKIEVGFSEEAITATKERHQVKLDQSQQAQAQVSASSSSSSSSGDTNLLPEPKYTTAEESAKLNAQFFKWVYQIPKFGVEKFRYAQADLFEISTTPQAQPRKANAREKTNSANKRQK
ncbi:DUF4340 domain-containing protein [bacterium]|nr:DUF4340 domain-containing protein [bacterium]